MFLLDSGPRANVNQPFWFLEFEYHFFAAAGGENGQSSKTNIAA